jgi:hypothetical protein
MIEVMTYIDEPNDIPVTSRTVALMKDEIERLAAMVRDRDTLIERHKSNEILP